MSLPLGAVDWSVIVATPGHNHLLLDYLLGKFKGQSKLMVGLIKHPFMRN